MSRARTAAGMLDTENETTMKELSRADFLKRCETIYDAGLARPEVLRLLDRWTDFVMRLEGGQMNYAVEFLEQERKRTQNFYPGCTLAADNDGYALIQMAAILVHPCNICATDLKAWWTRAAFCEHKKERQQP